MQLILLKLEHFEKGEQLEEQIKDLLEIFEELLDKLGEKGLLIEEYNYCNLGSDIIMNIKAVNNDCRVRLLQR